MDRLLCIVLCLMLIVVSVYVLSYCDKPIVEPPETTEEVTTEENTQVTTETTIATEPPTIPETTVPETTTAETESPLVLYDVPLSAELQVHIAILCEEYHIDPAIIVAMIFRESSFRTDVIGDNGNSYGLMQIQPKWHYDRMQKLGCTNLLDPFQNVTVGVDILANQIARYGGDVTKALVAYNRGSYSGLVTQYAKDVLAYAETIKN